MVRTFGATLALLALFVGLAQGHEGNGSTVGEDVIKFCSKEFIADNDHLNSVCRIYRNSKFTGKITGKVANRALSHALAFPHRLDDVDSMGQLPALSPDLCKINAEGLEGEAVTEFLLRLANNKISQQPKELRFSNLRVNGPFNAPSVTITHKLIFDHVVFCGPVNFSDAEVTGKLQFTNTVFVAGVGEFTEGIFRADGLRSNADIIISESRAGGILLKDAQISSRIGVTESAFGHVSTSGMKAEELSFHNSRQYQSIFTRTQTWLKQLRKFDVSQYEEVMGAYPLVFFASNIDLWDLRLDKLFYSDRLIVDGALAAVNAKIPTVRLRMAKLPAVDFRRLNADRVELFGATLGKAINRKDCEISRAFRYNFDFVSFQGADISGDFLLHPQPLEKSCNKQAAATRGLVCLNEMHVGGDFNLSAVSAKQINLRRTIVGATLSLASEAYGTMKFSPTDSFLDMRGMQIREISLSSDFVMPAQLRIAQSSVGGYVFTDNPDANLGDAHSFARLTTLIKTIDRMEERTLAYQVFETTLREAGQSIASSDMSFLREQSLTRSLGWGSRRLTRYVAEFLGGYGTKPVRTLFATAIATLIGAAIAWHSTEGRWFLMRQALSHRSLRRQSPNFRMWFKLWLCFDILVLSLDRLIPLVSISRPHKDLVFRRQRWVRAYFVFHAIFGFLLAGTTVAAISKGIGLH